MALNLKNIAEELKKKLFNFTNYTLPQTAARVASSPQLNQFAQRVPQPTFPQVQRAFETKVRTPLYQGIQKIPTIQSPTLRAGVPLLQIPTTIKGGLQMGVGMLMGQPGQWVKPLSQLTPKEQVGFAKEASLGVSGAAPGAVAFGGVKSIFDAKKMKKMLPEIRSVKSMLETAPEIGIAQQSAIDDLVRRINPHISKKLRTLFQIKPSEYEDFVYGLLNDAEQAAMYSELKIGLSTRELKPTQPKGVEVKPTQLDRIKVAQEEALQESIKPKVKIKGVVPTKVGVQSFGGEVIPKTPGGLSRPSAKSLAQDKYSFNVNMNRLDLTQPEKQTLRTTIESVKPELQNLKGKKLGNSEVLKAAKSSEILSSVVTREETLKSEAALLKARQTVTSLDKDINQLLKSGNTKQLETKMKELIESLRVVSSTAADTGRKLQSFSIKAGDESIRTSILKDISKTNANTEEILKEATKVDWNNANSITAFYRKFIKPTATEILDEYRYNNMLSNPRTHLRNAFSNLVQTFITRPATLLAQGKVGETAKYYKGSLKALPDAFGAFSDSISGKTAIAKPDIEHIATLKLPRFMTIPTRAMEAMDRFFSTIIQGGEMARGATTKEAKNIAEYSLFRQGLKPEGQGKLLNMIDNATEGIYQMGKKIPIMRWFVPFVRTPMNFAKQWIEYSPTGLATLPGAANKGEQLAKTLLGSIVTMAGAKLALDGNTTWAAPTDAKEKELFYASGRKPYSFRIGDKWVSMQYSGPFAPALAIPAATKYYQTESRTALTDTQMDKLFKISSSMAEFLSGQTFMEGLGNFVSMFKGDADYSLGKNLGYTASQMIPLQGLVRWVSTAIDPIYRKTKTAGEQIQSTIPFASKSLEPYTNPMGEPSTREKYNLFTPYDITPTNKGYEPMLEQRTSKLQANAVENKAVKDLEESKGNTTVNDKYLYWDEESTSVKKISLDFEVEKPKLVGVKEVDARLISGYKTKLTNKENDIITLWEKGVLNQEQAIEAISKMEELKKLATLSVKKPKKATIKYTKFKAPKITVKTGKTTKAPTIKFTKPKIKVTTTPRKYTISP